MTEQSHRWDVSPQEAVLLQKQLAEKVVRTNQLGTVTTVAGVDVGQKGDIARAAVVVLDFPGLQVKEFAVATRRITFPYIPGLLSFREGPVILDAIQKLSNSPELFIFDGQGIAHPRRLGIASHVGVLLDVPAIGCAKSRLCGRHQDPDTRRGSHAPLTDRGETIGAVLRTRTGVKPVFVSPGHKVDLPRSIECVLACCRKYRLPETTRHAHRLATDGNK
jgi:deoxyribonuclease V